MTHPALRPLLAALAVALAAPAFAASTSAEGASKKPAAAAAKGQGSQAAAKSTGKAPTQAKSGKAGDKVAKTAASKKDKAPVETGPGPMADFGSVTPSEEAAQVANWASYTRNNKGRSFILIDKKAARMYVFDAKGKLKGDSPVLLGSALGDHTEPGVGNKPLSQLKPEEKTTPAGRFLAQRGRNNHGEDILWIDYNAAVSMHRVRKVGDEHRAERLASPEIDDNRISNGCVNVPTAFYNKVLNPAVPKSGAYVYVLPDLKTLQQVFGPIDVPKA